MPALPLQLTPRPAMVGMGRSMSHDSLRLCTESLGCETGSSVDVLYDQPTNTIVARPSPEAAAADTVFPPPAPPLEQEHRSAGELTAVRYHHRSRPGRAFPPPLPSMTMSSCTTRMRRHRRDDGRLVLEAVPVVRPHAYLHEARRHGGRLTLCFVDCSIRHQTTKSTIAPAPITRTSMVMVPSTELDEDDEDMVELVDMGAASSKAQRSRVVINKLVGGAPDNEPSRCDDDDDEAPVPMTVAVAAASTEELVQSVRRCRQLRRRKPLFMVEPYSIASTSITIN